MRRTSPSQRVLLRYLLLLPILAVVMRDEVCKTMRKTSRHFLLRFLLQFPMLWVEVYVDQLYHDRFESFLEDKNISELTLLDLSECALEILNDEANGKLIDANFQPALRENADLINMKTIEVKHINRLSREVGHDVTSIFLELIDTLYGKGDSFLPVGQINPLKEYITNTIQDSSPRTRGDKFRTAVSHHRRSNGTPGSNKRNQSPSRAQQSENLLLRNSLKKERW